ncbi:SAG family member [Eimeria brunetti]|uniref:SAG family member n=1 Tax=Eimeria brunetti TaxID=51314 RepID=U6LD22_9EIME|nr:SAG family member [Eimeria brunetti]
MAPAPCTPAPATSEPVNLNEAPKLFLFGYQASVKKEKEARVAATPSEDLFVSGTYAFQMVDTNTRSCTAVVDKWKAAYKNFSGLPPSRKEGHELYSSSDNVSSVATYNSSENPAADFRVVTYTKTTTRATSNTHSGKRRNDPLKETPESSTTEKEEGHSLICLTTPDVLATETEIRPFTEDQWGKIVTAFEGSASTVLPSLLALASAALWLRGSGLTPRLAADTVGSSEVMHGLFSSPQFGSSTPCAATMRAPCLFTVVSASLFLLDQNSGGMAQETEKTTKYTVTLDNESACLAEINAARVNVGFNEFLAAKAGEGKARLPIGTSDSDVEEGNWVWKPVCNVLIPEGVESKTAAVDSGKVFVSGTYGFQVLSGSTPSCTAVVDKWKDAYKNFNGLPPPNAEKSELYSNNDNVSFVAMYNPSANAVADCRVVTCTKTTTPNKKTRGENTPNEKKGFALICLTTPDVLPKDNNTVPFTEEQWGKIVTAFEGSASAVLPSLLGLVAASLAALATM